MYMLNICATCLISRYRTGANAGFHEAIGEANTFWWRLHGHFCILRQMLYSTVGELMGLAAVIPGHLRTKVLVEEPETKENEERIGRVVLVLHFALR